MNKGFNVNIELCRAKIDELLKRERIEDLEIIDIQSITCSIDRDLSLLCKAGDEVSNEVKALIIKVKIKGGYEGEGRSRVEDLFLLIEPQLKVKYMETLSEYIDQCPYSLNKFIVKLMRIRECGEPYVIFIDETSCIGGKMD